MVLAAILVLAPAEAATATPATAAPAGADRPTCTGVATGDLPPATTITAVAAAPDGHAWAVGSTSLDPADPEATTAVITGWDGHQWRQVPLPQLPPLDGKTVTATNLSDVSVGRDGRTVAVGWQKAGGRPRTLVLASDASGWHPLPTLSGDATSTLVSYRLATVSAVSARDVWVGGLLLYHKPSMLLGVWNGSEWIFPGTPPAGGPTTSLETIAAINDHDVWTTGWVLRKGPIVSHWDGTVWTATPLAALDATGTAPSQVTGVAATAPDQIWLWGPTDTGGYLQRWTGTGWTLAPSLPRDVGNLTPAEVSVVGRDEAWLSGTVGVPAATVAVRVLLWRHGRWCRGIVPGGVLRACAVRTTIVAGHDDQPGWAVVNLASTPSGTATDRVAFLRCSTA